jgi:hypothetical protein
MRCLSCFLLFSFCEEDAVILKKASHRSSSCYLLYVRRSGTAVSLVIVRLTESHGRCDTFATSAV